MRFFARGGDPAPAQVAPSPSSPPEPPPAPLREDRLAPDGLPTVLVATMVRDEERMLARWVAHYGRHVGVENLLVVDDQTVDGSTTGLPCTVHRIPPLPGQGYEGARMGLMSGLASGLLAAYDVVVFVDADEFLVPDPRRYPTLRHLLGDRPGVPVLAPVALNVLHVPAVEPALEPDRPVLEQRSFAQFAALMCKPSIKRVDAPWRWASHGIGAPFAVDPDLWMLHLKFADRATLADVAAHRRRLVEADGRARRSSWSRTAEEVLEVFDGVVAGVDPGGAPELDPASLPLGEVVERRGDAHRAVGPGQLQNLGAAPVVRIPPFLRGTL